MNQQEEEAHVENSTTFHIELFEFKVEIQYVCCIFSVCVVRENLRELSKEYDRSEDDLKALQSGVGQIVGEVLRQLTEDKCKSTSPTTV